LAPGSPGFEQPGAHRALAGDKRGPAGSARLLAVIVGEDRPFIGDTVDVGRPVAHLAAVIGADVPIADIVCHNDEDVGLLLLGHCGKRERYRCERR